MDTKQRARELVSILLDKGGYKEGMYHDILHALEEVVLEERQFCIDLQSIGIKVESFEKLEALKKQEILHKLLARRENGIGE